MYVFTYILKCSILRRTFLLTLIKGSHQSLSPGHGAKGIGNKPESEVSLLDKETSKAPWNYLCYMWKLYEVVE